MINLSSEMREALDEHDLREKDLLHLPISDEDLDRIVAGHKRVDFRDLTEYYDQKLFPPYDEKELATSIAKPYKAVLFQSGEGEGARRTLVTLPQIAFTGEESELYHRSESPVIIDYYGDEYPEECAMADIVGDEIAQEAFNEGLDDSDQFFAILLGEVLLDEDPRAKEKAERWRQIHEEGPQLEQLVDEAEHPLTEEAKAMLKRHKLDPEEVLRLEVKRSHLSEILKDKCYLAILEPTGDFYEEICTRREEDDVLVAKPYRAILFETIDDEPKSYALSSLFIPTEEELDEGMPDEPLIIVYHGDSMGVIRTPEDALGVTLAGAVYERGLVEKDDFAVIPTNELLDSI